MRSRLAARGIGIGTAAAWAVIHLVHVAGVTAGPIVVGGALGFICRIH
jgi:hypothetical protein